MRCAGLDLARRRDHSALVTIMREPDRLIITGALRLPHRPYAEQIEAIRPLLEAVDVLCFDATGVGLAVGELLPAGAIPILIVAGESASKRESRWHIGKMRLISDLLHLARAGRLVVPPECPGGDDLRREMAAFAIIPTKRGVRLEARGGGQHDDLVLATALAVFAARAPKNQTF